MYVAVLSYGISQLYDIYEELSNRILVTLSNMVSWLQFGYYVTLEYMMLFYFVQASKNRRPFKFSSSQSGDIEDILAFAPLLQNNCNHDGD